MRLVRAADELEDAFSTAANEADAAFGDPTMYVEKALVPARHVEIQVVCDHHGNVLTLGERECSIQRRHQKLIEESPSAALTPDARERWKRPPSAHVARSGTATPEPSNSCSAPTATSTSSS